MAMKLDVTKSKGASTTVSILNNNYDLDDNVYLNNIILNNEILKYYYTTAQPLPTPTKMLSSLIQCKLFDFINNYVHLNIFRHFKLSLNSIYVFYFIS